MVEFEEIIKWLTLGLGIGAIIFAILALVTATSIQEKVSFYTFLAISTAIWVSNTKG